MSVCRPVQLGRGQKHLPFHLFGGWMFILRKNLYTLCPSVCSTSTHWLHVLAILKCYPKMPSRVEIPGYSNPTAPLGCLSSFSSHCELLPIDITVDRVLLLLLFCPPSGRETSCRIQRNCSLRIPRLWIGVGNLIYSCVSRWISQTPPLSHGIQETRLLGFLIFPKY